MSATACKDDQLTLTRDDGLSWYRSSDTAQRGFCRICGSVLFWKGDGRDYTAITAGSIDGPLGVPLEGHIFCSSAGDYYEIAGGRFPHRPARRTEAPSIHVPQILRHIVEAGEA